MNKKRALSILLIIAMLATNLPTQMLDVFAASETYDIEYSNGAFTENGEVSDKGISDYFTMKKITTSYEEDGTTQKGATITEEGETTIGDSNIQLPNSTWTSKTAEHTSYLMEFDNSVQYNNVNREIESYEVTTASKLDWIGRPNGLLLPFYYDSNLDGYFGLFFITRSSNAYFQYGYSFVGRNREYANNSVKEVALTTRTDADGNTIASTMKINLAYVYSDDGATIEKITFSVTECWVDGETTTLFDNLSFTVADITTGNKGFIGGANGASGYITSDNCPTSFASSGAVAGVISGINDKKSTISGIKVSLSKTEDEINNEAAGALPDLYQAFLANKCYETANAYLEVYSALPDENKLVYSEQIVTINAYLKSVLVSNGVFNFDKATLSNYPAVLEHVWSTSDVEDTDNTYPSAEFYSNTDVTSATAVFDRSAISTSTIMYMFTDLVEENTDVDQDASDNFGLVNDFGTTFTNNNTAITFYTDENGTTGKKSLPIINATDTNLGIYSYNVVYKSQSAYGTDVWANDFKNATESNPLPYDDYMKVSDTTSANYLPYMAVEFDYKATELTDNGCTKINFIARLWADDGDGIYEEETDVMLAQKDRSDETASAYMAIAYLNDEPRERNFALTGNSYKALHSLVLGSPSAFLAEYAELVAEAEAFDITNYMSMSDDDKTELKTQINAFLSGYNAHEAMIQSQADVTEARTNIVNMLGAIVLEETGADPSVFETDYAETLALDSERLAPYDIAAVDEMLAVYDVFEDVAANALATETVAKITALRETRNAWNMTSDATIATSYQTIWSENLTTNPNAAWNVYSRLTASQKALLTNEYDILVTTLKGQTQTTDDTINVYCVGDSITNGNGSTNSSTDAYPVQLQTKLIALNSLYSVSKFAVGGSHVYKWEVEEGATENTVFTETVQWEPSHDGNADIVILQLGTNDLDNVIALSEAGEQQYLETFESIVQSYLRLENSPYVIISNTPVNYKNVDSTVAELNMQIADKYGLPCVDMYAYTGAYSSEEITAYYNTDKLHFTTAGYEVMAQVFCDAINSLTMEFDTADVTGYSFDESEFNSFLTPELYSATIKNETDPARQGLGFETNIGKYHRTGSKIVEYGTIFVRYENGSTLDDYSDMVLENVGDGKHFKGYFNVTDDTGLLETSYIAGVNCSSDSEFGRVYIARSYIKYADGSVYYSINTRTDKVSDAETAINNRVGVYDGYACRSLISVAKNMLIALAEENVDAISGVATYVDKNLTISEAGKANNAEAIFDVICNNREALDACDNGNGSGEVLGN